MRLLHVMAEMDPAKGGVGQAVRTMMEGLAEKGIHSEAVTVDAPGSTFLRSWQLNIHALGPAKGAWAYSRKLGAWLRENLVRFDVVIVHGLWLYPGFATRQQLKKLKNATAQSGKQQLPKLFVMPHGMLDPYFQKAPGRKWKAIRNWLYWKWIEAPLVNSAAGVLFTTAEEQRLAGSTFMPYRPQKEYVSGIGVKRPEGYSNEMKTAFEKICPQLRGSAYYLFLGRIDAKKGLDMLVRSYLQLKEQNKGLIPKLVIAGPGLEKPFGRELVQLAAGAVDDIFFTGMLLSDAKWGAIYGCEVFVLPSHQENFGIAVAEAFGLRKACPDL